MLSYERDNIFLPYPLNQLSRKLRKEQSNFRPVIDSLIDNYVKESGEGYLKVNDLFLKLLEDEENNLQTFNRHDDDELKIELERIDKGFQPAFKLIEELSWNQKKELFLDNFEFLAKVLREMRIKHLEWLKEKEEPKQIDYLMYTYLSHLNSLMEFVAAKVREAGKEEMDQSIFIGVWSTVIYGSLVTAYFSGKLKEDVLLKRASEIAVAFEPSYRKINKRVRKALEDVSDTVPVIG